MVDDLGWWAIPIVTLVIFTLYGIEGIGSQLEDPFGYDRNDIKMDAICHDANIEIEVVLAEWRKFTTAAEIATKQQTAQANSLSGAPNTDNPAPVRVRYDPGNMFIRTRGLSTNYFGTQMAD